MQPALKKPGFVLPPMFELIRLRKQYFLRRNKENYHGKVQRADGTEYIPFAGLGAPEVDLALAAIFNDRYPKVWVVDPQQDGADYWTKAMLDNAEAIAVRCTPIAEGNHKEPCLNLLQYYAAKVALEFNLKERVSSSPDNKKPYIIDFPISYKGGPHGVSFFAQIVGNEIKISYVNSAGNLYVPEADRDLMFEKIKAGFESQGVTVNQKLEIVTGVTQNDATTCAIQQMMDAKNYIEDALAAKKAINLSDPKLRKPRSLEDCFHFLSRVQNAVRGILGDDDIVDREPQNVAQKFSDLFTTVKSLDLANLSFTKNKSQEDFYKTLDDQRSQTLLKLPGAGATAGGPDYRGTPPKVTTPQVNFAAFEAEIITQANALNLKADKTSEGTYTITDQTNTPLGTIKKVPSGIRAEAIGEAQGNFIKLYARSVITAFEDKDPIPLNFDAPQEPVTQEQVVKFCEGILSELKAQGSTKKITVSCKTNPSVQNILQELQRVKFPETTLTSKPGAASAKVIPPKPDDDTKSDDDITLRPGQ